MASIWTYSDSGVFSWTASFTGTASIECWGGGGGGGGQNLSSDGGGGGGGGAYAIKNEYAITSGNSYTVSVGAGGSGGTGGSGTAGGDSYFVSTSIVMAKGGQPGVNSTGTPPSGGAGGLASSSVGDTKYNGGQGEKGSNNTIGQGGYGGSSAGRNSDGVSGPQTFLTIIYPTGSTPAAAGVGGNGGDTGLNGSAPSFGSGGGGGGSGDGTNRSGGNGWAGKVVITATYIYEGYSEYILSFNPTTLTTIDSVPLSVVSKVIGV
jgi:hypothetical protein